MNEFEGAAIGLFEQHFTVEEAKAWLPKLRRRFNAAKALYAQIGSLQADYGLAIKRIHQNGHAPRPTTFEAKVVELQSLLQDIIEAGIQIKDVERGLVDFPHWRDGEEVFLCWELNDEGLDFWHTVEDGFPGRMPI